jgi:hypothetical protein
MNGTSAKRSNSANQASSEVGEDRIKQDALSTRRTHTRSPGSRNAKGNRTA